MLKFTILNVRKYVNGLLLWQRLAIFLLALFFIFLLWVVLMFMPLQSGADDLHSDINMRENALAMLQKHLVVPKQEDENKAKLQAKDNGAQEKEIIVSIEAVKNLPKLLTDLLRKQRKLTLLSLDNTPRLVQKNENKKGKRKGLYKHTMVLHFSGEYFATLNYLRTLEKLKWHIYWDKLEYTVVKYPLAEITLELHIFQNGT